MKSDGPMVIVAVDDVGMVRLRRRLSLRHVHYSLTIMALSDTGLTSGPHATVNITVLRGPRGPQFTQRLYQMSVSEVALRGTSVGTVSMTHCECLSIRRINTLASSVVIRVQV